jgi:glycosyltransferase involved in cell wall biosynthesis
MTLADEIVVASESVADYYFPDHINTTTIYSPVDITKFDPETVTPTEYLTKSRESKETVVIGTVGNVNPIKGHKHFIRAIAMVKAQTDRRVIAPIVGAKLDSREAYYAELVELCEELGVSENVVFLDKRDDIPELMAQFDVFVLSSIAEACPMVGGVPEQITDGEEGWLVPAKNPPQLAAAIGDVLQNQNEATIRSQKARQRVCSMFSLEQCVRRHEQLYRSLV